MPDKDETTEAEDTGAVDETPEGAEAAGTTPEEPESEEIAPEEAGAEEEAAEEAGAAEAAAEAADEEASAEAGAADEGEAKPKPKKPAKKKPARKAKKKADRAEVKVPAVKPLSGKDLKLNPAVFEVEAKVGVIHEVVRAEMAARRAGTAATKTRGQVRGGGAKPWRQKGTGRARAGSSRIPHWTGGGVTFGPTPKDYSFKINRKVRSKALKMALSERVREGNLRVVDGLEFDEPRTAAAAAVLEGLDVTYPLLVLVGEDDANVALSFRNIDRVDVADTGDLMVSDIIGARTVLTTSGVIEQLNGIGEGK